MSAVYVDSIKDKSDTKTLATLSSSSVTLHSDVTYPTKITDRTYFYHSVSHLNSSAYQGVEVGNWSLGRNLENGPSRTAGVAPTGFSSCTAIKYYLMEVQGGGSVTLEMAWSISASASDGTSRSEHTLSGTAVSNGAYTASADEIYGISLLGVGGSNVKFEDLISPGDAFTFYLRRSAGSFSNSPIGIAITYRF